MRAHSRSTSDRCTNRITTVTWTGPTPITETLTYDRQTGNITNIARENGAYAVAFDAVDQLVSSTGLYSKSFIYDLLGNRINGSDGPGTNVNNFLLSNGTSSFLADPDGFGDIVKETSAAAVKNYTYRADDLLNSVQNGTTSAAYYFDALGRRVAKIISQGAQSFYQSYAYLGLENRILMGQAGDGSPLTTYIDGQGIDEHLAEVKAGVGKGYVVDHLGSVLNGDAAGTSHSFGLFGETSFVAIAPSSNPAQFGFAGREFDESGNYYNRARQYSPVTGRFLSQDPIGFTSKDSNYYRYVFNRPQLRRDPSGKICQGDGSGQGIVSGQPLAWNWPDILPDPGKVIPDPDSPDPIPDPEPAPKPQTPCEKARAHAREVCDFYGESSGECSSASTDAANICYQNP